VKSEVKTYESMDCRASIFCRRDGEINVGPIAQFFCHSAETNAPPACFNVYTRETSREIPMLKGVVGLVTVLFVAGSAYAQEASHAGLSPAELNVLTDARIGMAKAVLQLTPEQAKFWPAIENAIHARAEARQHRIGALKGLAERIRQHDVDLIDVMRVRADSLTERGASLKKLAEAWQPLYQTLNPDQKQRMRLVAMHVLREVRSAAERRRMEMMESEEDEAD
jgi:LTXXQ motif family protein